jgi:hypothetical protein
MPTWPLQNAKSRFSELVKLSLIDTLLQAPRGEPLELERSPEPIRDVDLVTRNERDFEPAGVPLPNLWVKTV